VTDYVTWRSSVLTAARLAGVPTVVHVRSPLGSETFDPELVRATILVGNSKATVRAIMPHRRSDSVRVVYNFVDFDSFDHASDRRHELVGAVSPVVGFLGVFRPEKGIEYFLEMARIVSMARPDIRFLAVGGESAVSDIGWFPRMREYARELGIDRVVTFTGSRDDVPNMMKSMDVLVVPSLNEGFGRVIIEANAVGVPVVGADAAGIPEVIEDGQTGLLVPPRDSKGLADAVIRLLDDHAWRQRLARELPAQVREKFSPERQMALLQEAWDDAIAYSRRA
jgi:glycosyltransferase involved in cell wall biosynthesis